MAPEQRHFQTNPDVIMTEMEDGESVLLDVRTRKYYSLNDTGSLIWSLVVKRTDEDGIAVALTKSYDVEYSEAVREVREFVADCEKDGLIVHSG